MGVSESGATAAAGVPDGQPDRYAVVGNPIGHSKSPLIHTMFAGQTGARMRYQALLASKGAFPGLVAEFFRGGGKGLNITIPFKQAAWALCDRLSPSAARSKAVNTLLLRDGELFGANTDGIGLVRDIRDNLGIEIHGRRILLLGAGGAVRGVLPALADEAPGSMTVCNRTPERGQELAAEFGAALVAANLESLTGKRFDLIINGTSASLQGRLPPLADSWPETGCCCYDMVYADGETAFARWALGAGAAVAADGLGMLVEQAAESFRIWHGDAPETGAVIRHLRGN